MTAENTPRRQSVKQNQTAKTVFRPLSFGLIQRLDRDWLGRHHGAMGSIIYLLRHGETHWNRAGRLQGQLDSPLTLRGLDQARAMGRTLAPLLAERTFTFWASPIGRCRQSAAIIAETIGFAEDGIRLDDRLKEITLGDWDGARSWAALDTDHPEEAAKRRANPWHYQYPNGESSQLVEDRVVPFFLELEATPGIHVVVAHGVVNKILRGFIQGLDHAATFALDRPQDGFYRIENRRVELITTDAPN